jgi:DNA-binding response OmpR family regulator
MRNVPCALVVDDAPATRERLNVLLRLAGWRVYGVSGMAEALRATAQLTPDLVVTEARLQGGSGLALIDQLRRNGSRARCLILTARPTPRLRAQAAALGSTCLAKPLDPGQLIEFLGGRRPAPPGAAYGGHRIQVSAERVRPSAPVEPDEDDDDEPSWDDRQRRLYLSALPHHLSWIAQKAREGDASAVADEAHRLAKESDRNGELRVARVSSTIARDAERGILSQPKLMQLVLLASAAGGR